MYSIYFANFFDASRAITGISDGISIVGAFDTVLTSMIGTTYNGMIVIGTLCSFSLTIFSISSSISLICAFFSMINFNISSLWPSVSTISFACGSSVAVTFSCFL
jgi:hypothetical protein